jgi:hypothetical protein
MTNSQSKKCAISKYTYQKLLLPLQLVDDFALLLQPLLEALLNSRMDNCNDADVVSWARLFSLKQQQIPSLTRHSAFLRTDPRALPLYRFTAFRSPLSSNLRLPPRTAPLQFRHSSADLNDWYAVAFPAYSLWSSSAAASERRRSIVFAGKCLHGSRAPQRTDALAGAQIIVVRRRG